MSVEFRSTEFKDAVIFSGIDVVFKDQLAGSSLKGDALQQAFKDLEKSYVKHKQNVRFKFPQFLHIVEDNVGDLKNPSMPSKVRQAVAHKLNDLADQRLQRESKFNFVHTFFHKLGQLFKGHGFRTMGEWGKKVAAQIEKVDAEIYMAQLKQWMKGAVYGQLAPEVVTALMLKINQLPDEQFKGMVNKLVLNQKEPPVFGAKNKFAFYMQLNESKQAVFMQELLAKSDWYERVYDIIEGADAAEIKKFIPAALIKKFQENSQIMINAYRKDPKGPWGHNFFYLLLGAALKEHLTKNEFAQIGTILSSRNQKDMEFSLDQLKEALTSEEMQKLSENVNVFSR